MTDTQYIKWTYEGQQKVAAFELGEKCVVTDVSTEQVKREVVEITPSPIPRKAKKSTKGGCSGCGATGLKRLLQGSAGLLKAELGIDAADDATIENRKAICLNCDNYDFGVCNDCGCFCAAKVKLKSGSPCPQGKW